MEVLVCVKAYPSLSMKYGEAVCVAGVRLDTPRPEWVRFFPVGFRDLPRHQRFAKYQVIRLRACKHSGDRRRETWRPDVDSIELGEVLPPGGIWAKRRPHIEPLLGPTMCQLNRGRTGGTDAPSLAVVRPARVRRIVVKPEDEWTTGQRAIAEQGNLLTLKTALVQPGHAFHYDWMCEEPGCRGHTQKIVDWELGESYRSWRERGDELVAAIEARWLDDMCADTREPLFFVGDQHRFPGKFLNLGTFYPERRPNEGQLTLSLAA